MKKNKSKDMILGVLTFLGTYFFYYYIDYLFNTDVLNVVTIRKNGTTISFIGFFLFLITSVFVLYIIEIIRKYIEKRKKQ
jgi:hypothetical protein